MTKNKKLEIKNKTLQREDKCYKKNKRKRGVKNNNILSQQQNDDILAIYPLVAIVITISFAFFLHYDLNQLASETDLEWMSWCKGGELTRKSCANIPWAFTLLLAIKLTGQWPLANDLFLGWSHYSCSSCKCLAKMYIL